MSQKNQDHSERGKPEGAGFPPEAEQPAEALEEADEAVRKPYRNIWLFLIAFGLLPLLGYSIARGAGALGGFFLGIIVEGVWKGFITGILRVLSTSSVS